MGKLIKTIKYLFLSIGGVYLIYIITTIILFNSKIDFKMPDEYTWILKDSIKNDMREFPPPYSYIGRRDIYNNFFYQDSIRIIVWEFKNFGDYGLNDISFHQNSNFYDNKDKIWANN